MEFERSKVDTGLERSTKLGRFGGLRHEVLGLREPLDTKCRFIKMRSDNRWMEPARSPAASAFGRYCGNGAACGKGGRNTFKHESVIGGRSLIRPHVATLQRRRHSRCICREDVRDVAYRDCRYRCCSHISSSESAASAAMLSETCAMAVSRLSLPRLLPASATMAVLGR